MERMPEILAPAGDFATLKAAVSAGADAIYLGGEQFELAPLQKILQKKNCAQQLIMHICMAERYI